MLEHTKSRDYWVNEKFAGKVTDQFGVLRK